MRPSTERHYARQADWSIGKYRENRPHRSDLVQSEGATGRAWLKFNPGAQLIYVNDAEGHPRALTPKQYAVLTAVFDVIAAGKFTTMRAIAADLGYAASTVSRALVKLTAWGIIGYISGRGRYAATYLFRRADGDGFDRLRTAAKRRLKAFYERISRSRFNVAPMKPTTTYGRFTVSGTRDVDSNDIVATLNGWTPDELRSVGIL